MNVSTKITSIFEFDKIIRPRGLKEAYYEHDCNWLFYVYDGKLGYSDDENELELLPGRFYILPAKKPFVLKEINDVSLNHFYALIGCVPLMQSFLSVDVAEFPFLKDLTRLLEKYLQQKNEVEILTVLEAILSYILTEHSTEENLAKRIKDYIDCNIPDFCVHEICRRFHYSRRYLDMKFKEAYSVTVDKYASDKRFSYVLEQVVKGESLKSICDKINYSSPANLSRDFKKRFGLSPAQFRKFSEIQKQSPQI